MQSGKREAKRESKHIARWLLIILLIVIVGKGLCGRVISEAKQRSNVQQCQIMLEDFSSFEITVENLVEEMAIKQVVEEFNKEHGYKKTQYQYKVYKIQAGRYWITSEFIHEVEFSRKEEEYFNCVMDIDAGFLNEEVMYVFVYMTEEQRLAYEEMKILSRMAAGNALVIQEEQYTCKEVTFMKLTVKPKSNFVTESGIVPLSV